MGSAGGGLVVHHVNYDFCTTLLAASTFLTVISPQACPHRNRWGKLRHRHGDSVMRSLSQTKFHCRCCSTLSLSSEIVFTEHRRSRRQRSSSQQSRRYRKLHSPNERDAANLFYIRRPSMTGMRRPNQRPNNTVGDLEVYSPVKSNNQRLIYT